MDVQAVLDDLVAEQHSLDDVVASLAPEQWELATPSPGWTVADQIGHLSYFDATAAMAISDPPAFIDHRDALAAMLDDAQAVENETLGEFRRLSNRDQLARWRQHRLDLADAGRTLDDDARIEWYGPTMGSKSFLTARLMEAWAHGQDICDAVDAIRRPTDRLRHIAQLGVITRGWSYAARGATKPDTDVRVELEGPSGDTWTWGPDDAPARISGPAIEFCLVVTQRRHVDDTSLAIVGDDAREWMLIAQAFAGGASDGPAPRRARTER